MKPRFPLYPSLYQINTRVRLAELASVVGRAATLDDIPDIELDHLAECGFDLVWLLGVWQTGAVGREIAMAHPDWIKDYRATLPGYTPADVCSSCFAVREYHVNTDFGGDEALGRIRERLMGRGIRLMLDFVPNHTAIDHPWVVEHPEFYVSGSEHQLAGEPENFTHARTGDRSRIFAHGRDPYFSGWPDTLQLNYSNPDLQNAMLGELQRIATQCDGVRCDMAMLELPEVFERTWGMKTQPFWPRVTETIHRQYPAFVMMAEVYWGLEWTLQQQGFNFTYDKILYDRLSSRNAHIVRDHLRAGLNYQDKLARFLENHDEPRAATTFSPAAVEKAAATVTYFAPGLRLFHQGQLQGKRVRIPMTLSRGPVEAVDAEIAQFYTTLLHQLRDPAVRSGSWHMLECRPASHGNDTSDNFIVFGWSSPPGQRRLVAVNYSDRQSQCYVPLPWPGLRGHTLRLTDRMGKAGYDRSGAELAEKGLFLDLPPWGYHVFEARVTDKPLQKVA